MRLQQLQLLQHIAEIGSLRAAAERMHVSQPALTKALRHLEDEFGTTLVTRSPRGARLSAAGELLSARAGVALRELDRAREEVAWHVERTHGSVALGVSPAAAAMLVPATLDRFLARWPTARVRLLDTLYPRAFSQLRAGEIDLAIGPLPSGEGSRDIRVLPLFASPLVVTARKGHRLQCARRLAALAEARWLLTGPAGGPGDPALLDLGAKSGADTPATLVCESFSTLLALMREGDYLAVMPQGFFDFYGPPMNLVRLPIRDPLPITPVYAMWRAEAPLTVLAQRLLDAFAQEASEIASPAP